MVWLATRLSPLLLLTLLFWSADGAWAAVGRIPPDVAPKMRIVPTPSFQTGGRRTPPAVTPRVRDWRLVEQTELSGGGGVYRLRGQTLAALVEPPAGPPPAFLVPKKSRRSASRKTVRKKSSPGKKVQSAPKGGWKYVIQVAAYRGPQSAQSGKARLEKVGLPVYILSRGKGKRSFLHLRAGPFPDRSAAKEARRRIKRMRGFRPGRIIKRK